MMLIHKAAHAFTAGGDGHDDTIPATRAGKSSPYAYHDHCHAYDETMIIYAI